MMTVDDERAVVEAAYVQAYPDLAIWAAHDGLEAVSDHFDAFGRAEGRIRPPLDPVPADWANELFLAAHPELKPYWDYGTIRNLVHFARNHGVEAHGRLGSSERIRETTSLNEELISDWAEVELRQPRSGSIDALVRPKTMWLSNEKPVLGSILAQLEKLNIGRWGHRAVIATYALRTGGAELEAYWLYRGAEALGLFPILLIVDEDHVSEYYRTKDLKFISMPQLVAEASDAPFSAVSEKVRAAIFLEICEQVSPDVVHVVNSYIGLSALRSLRNDKRSAWFSARTIVSLFCPDIKPSGELTGYMNYIPELDGKVAGYSTDSHWYATKLQADYGIDSDRMFPLKYPVLPTPRLSRGSEQTPVKFLWASRLDYQKNVKVVFDIGILMPEAEFDIFGRSVLNDTAIDWSLCPDNVRRRGEFDGISELPLHEYSGFLYTSLFDGLPNILLEITAAGLPIVTSAVGGIAEVFGVDAAILVEDPLDALQYVRGLRELINDGETAQARADRARARILEDRSLSSFTAALQETRAYRQLFGRGVQRQEARESRLRVKSSNTGRTFSIGRVR